MKRILYFVLLASFIHLVGSCSSSGTNTNIQGTDTRTCIPPTGTSGSPQSITEAVALINALPKPVTVPCFLESLDRPLGIYGTSNVISAQPAGGPKDPRIFILIGKLVISVVSAGDAKMNVEFSDLLSDTTSIKGDLLLPLSDTISASLPYERILLGSSGTACAFCHTGEVAGPTPNTFVSLALRPDPFTKVPIAKIKKFYETCDPNDDEYRCQVYTALFAHGEVSEKEFPSAMPHL